MNSNHTNQVKSSQVKSSQVKSSQAKSSQTSLNQLSANQAIRTDWLLSEINAFYRMPMNDLLFKAHTIHRQNFNPNEIQTSSLMSIKTGACPEDCAYCPQSGHYDTGLSKEQLVALEKVIQSAKKAKNAGASRFCMGAAWRSPNKKKFPLVLQMVTEVKRLGMETCMTLGMLDQQQAHQLKQAGLDYYNHNLDTSEDYYQQIITTRTFADRLKTLAHVRDAGMKVCAGGILGMGESTDDRLALLQSLSNLPEHPQSVPINQLIPVKGTPLQDAKKVDSLEFIRLIAVARILMPKSAVRLSAGRENMSDEMQAMCFFAGANSIFYGEKLLTTDNPDTDQDLNLFARLGINQQKIDRLNEFCPDNSSKKNTNPSHVTKPLYRNAAI